MLVIFSMHPLTLAGAAASPGYALKVAEDGKMAAHFEAIDSRGGGVSMEGGVRRLL